MDLTQHNQNEPRHDITDIDGRDSGAIVLGWLTKLALVAIVVGTVGFDGISVGVARFSTTDDANTAAQAASQSFEVGHNLQLAYTAATHTLNAHESIKTTDFDIAPDGTTSLTLTNTANTLVFYRTSATKGLAVIKVRVTGKYTGS